MAQFHDNLIPASLYPGATQGLSEWVWDEAEQGFTQRNPGSTSVYIDGQFYIEPGEYILEAEIKASAPGTNTYVGLLGLGTDWNYRYGISNVPVGTEWTHYSAPLLIPEGGEGEVRVRFLPAYNGDKSVTTWYRNVYLYRAPSLPPARSGVAEVGIATSAREGLVSDIFVRSREKIEVQLAQPDEQLIAGERIELAAFAATSTEVSWTWRQVTGPPVEIERRDNAAHFIAPDVDRPTDLRIACRASSTDGANRSNWHFFDLTIQPPRTRWIPDEGADFTPRSPQMVGYDRGKREIWNDVTLPNGMDPNGRWESTLRDLGIPADDVQFVMDGEPPARAAAGGVYIDMETHDIYRNFGDGYNESDDTEGAPRRNAYMVNPATGDIFEWREGES